MKVIKHARNGESYLCDCPSLHPHIPHSKTTEQISMKFGNEVYKERCGAKFILDRYHSREPLLHMKLKFNFTNSLKKNKVKVKLSLGIF
jgi:hypothetical protein